LISKLSRNQNAHLNTDLISKKSNPLDLREIHPRETAGIEDVACFGFEKHGDADDVPGTSSAASD